MPMWFEEAWLTSRSFGAWHLEFLMTVRELHVRHELDQESELFTGRVPTLACPGKGPMQSERLHATATTQSNHGTDVSMVLPDFSSVRIAGLDGRSILFICLGVSLVGVCIGIAMLRRVRAFPTHPAMSEVAELIWATCKTYLRDQGKFVFGLNALISLMIVVYFGFGLELEAFQVITILLSSIAGILGSYGVAWFGIRVNTYANARTAFASLTGRAYPVYSLPLKAGMSIGMLLISVELALLLTIALLVPAENAGPCLLGFAIGESLGAATLRIAGGIFTKIADIGADLMKIVFKIKEDDARNPGVIADCAGDNAGDSVGPSADGFETYGVTVVALVSFVLAAVRDPQEQVRLLLWTFAVGATMLLASFVAYLVNQAVQRKAFARSNPPDFERPLTTLVWITAAASIPLTVLVSYSMLSDLGNGTQWRVLAAIVCCGTAAGAIIPEVIKVFTSTRSSHVAEVVTSSREGGASLNVLSGLTAGNFGAFWMGGVIAGLMAIAYFLSGQGLDEIMIAAPVFGFGLLAFGFLGMAPVTIAVDSYGPVTDNAQSIFELSTIADLPDARFDIQRQHRFNPEFEEGKRLLELNDGAGNTFKATAKPVLIGTAVVGATTMIFSIVVLLTDGLSQNLDKFSLLHPPFVLGLMAGGAVIFWFTGATTQAVVAGAYHAVDFIKRNLQLSDTKASREDSQRVVGICTRYAQAGTLNIFLVVFFATLAFAATGPFFFIGYLAGLALFGLSQALFLANAGGAWDNAKKVVEVDLAEKGSPLHDACIVGDTVGDPFKDTSSVAMNPVIKFATLFGVLAVELALKLEQSHAIVAALVLGAAGLYFVWRSFYRMRIAVHSVETSDSRAE
jgi:K(+)-stimulated pyrophosphate-energized sodium pump